MRRPNTVVLVALAALLAFAPSLSAQPAGVPDTHRAGPLDNGKMWLFEQPPIAYLDSTYDFRPDADWFERARLGALRISGCSAAFVSPNGLVATNHHCVRSQIVEVAEEGESLLDDGFVAMTLDEERPVPGFYADQLIAIADVTAEIEAELGDGAGAVTPEQIEAATDALAEQLANARGGEDAGIRVEVVALYEGGRFSAYTFQRYEHFQLVMAPEYALGSFGGDADNFTFPRYSLDFAFLRATDADGGLLTVEHYFPLAQDGASAGDLVFVIGNPGSTSRQATVAQLQFRRDLAVPTDLAWVTSRTDALAAYLAQNPNDDTQRVTLSSLLNFQKSLLGQQDALRNEVVMARRADSERQFREAGAGDLIDQMAAVQSDRRALGDAFQAFSRFGSQRFSSGLMLRALIGAQGDAERLATIENRPDPLERLYFEADIATLRRYYAKAGLPMPEVLRGASDAAVAAKLRSNTALTDAASTQTALDNGGLPTADVLVQLGGEVLGELRRFYQASGELTEREQAVARAIGQKRFAVYGTAVPPDATFSPRITDGLVRGYEYNGTVAAPFTTFFGLYDHYNSYCDQDDPSDDAGAGAGACMWALPERWLPVPDALALGTPVNFSSTADTIGGNSGSPVVNRDLELVGINFDRTIEGLARNYLYFAEIGRNVSVDARGILESLRSVYQHDRLVTELTTGEL
ncbi:MAG: S46 family peptidase [Bacteroidota bacterium]